MASSTSIYNLILQAIHENSVSKFRDVARNCEEVTLLVALCQSNEQGQTPLVVAIKQKYFNVIDEMITRIMWIYWESSIEMCLCSSAIVILFHHQIPVVELIDYLITNVPRTPWLDLILAGLKSCSIPREEKITALELMGALLILFDDQGLRQGLQCWKEAMLLRYSSTNGGNPIPKIPDVQSVISQKVFGTEVEVTSMEQLEHLKQQWILSTRGRREDRSLFHEALKVQALLVVRRIVNQVNPGQPGPYYTHLISLLKYGNDLQHDFNRKINVHLLALEQIPVFDPKMAPSRFVAAYENTLRSMLDCYKEMLKKPINSPEREELSASNLLSVIKFCTSVANFFPIPDSDYYESLNSFEFPRLTYKFVMMLDGISPQLNEQENQQLGKYLYNHNSMVVRYEKESTYTAHPLNVAVMGHRDLKYIQLLLKFGADPNALDSEGENSLHILANMWNWYSSEEDSYYFAVYQALMNAGGHLDFAGSSGQTVISCLKENRRRSENSENSNYVDSVINTVFPLSCYCARVIRKHGIPFEDHLPLHLLNFVRIHSAKGY